jgi:hypothetical protein
VHTPANLTDAAHAAFAGVAGGVVNDSPFAGTYVPLAHWRRTPQVRSIMIEVRRDLYQSEPGGPLHSGYDPVMRRLGYFLSRAV